MPVVLLHALPFDGSMWDPVRDRLGLESLAPTLYRFGDDLEEWAAGVLAEVGPGPLTLVGNSVGGSCAIEIARMIPACVQCLVLVGAKAGHRPEPELRDEALRVLARDGVDAAWARYWRPRFGPRADPAVITAAAACARAQPHGWIERGLRAFHGRTDRASWLHAWRGRTIIVCGEFDVIPVHPAALAADLADGRFVEIEGAGHYVPLEAPEALAAIIDGTA